MNAPNRPTESPTLALIRQRRDAENAKRHQEQKDLDARLKEIARQRLIQSLKEAGVIQLEIMPGYKVRVDGVFVLEAEHDSLHGMQVRLKLPCDHCGEGEASIGLTPSMLVLDALLLAIDSEFYQKPIKCHACLEKEWHSQQAEQEAVAPEPPKEPTAAEQLVSAIYRIIDARNQ